MILNHHEKSTHRRTVISLGFPSRRTNWLRPALALFGLAGFMSAAPVITHLAADGKALLPITIAQEAETSSTELAATLATMLGRISGATFEVVPGDGTAGIVVGTVKDFPDLALSAKLDPTDPMRREEYRLVSHAKGLLLLGAAPVGLENAVWDLLYRLGYRQFFPGPVWEVVPSSPSLEMGVDIHEKPAYLSRRIGYHHGVAGERRKIVDAWAVRNRLQATVEVKSSHAYGGIIAANKEAFAEHPEYIALVDGKRSGSKFCISNPGLRALVVDHAERVMRKNPTQESLSMDPSDGAGWCECDACASMGSVSDRVLTLANDVAEAINKLGLGPRYVGIYAYNYHSPPPSINVHPNVVVNATTAFIRGGFTLDQLIKGWQARGAVMGYYDYFAIMPWDWDLPGRARASSPNYMGKSIPRYYSMGMRFFVAEAGESWGPHGLGMYAASRILWDLKEADQVDAIREDFLQRAFGPAAEPAREFYRLIDSDNRPLLSGDLLGRMYRAVQQGLDLTKDRPDIQTRFLQLALYTRYAELFLAGDMTDYVRHAYRMRETGMMSFRALWATQKSKMSLTEIPEAWTSNDTYSAKEVQEIITQGLAKNKIFEFDPVSFSRELVPTTPLNLPDTPQGTLGASYMNDGSQGGLVVYTWFDQPGTLNLQVGGGYIAHYRDRGHVKVSLYPEPEALPEPVAFDNSVPPDGVKRPVSLTTPDVGLHRLEMNDGGDSSVVIWPDNWPWTLMCSPDAHRLPMKGDWTLVFYVPKGTKSVAGYTDDKNGKVVDGTGKTVLLFSDLEVPGYFNIPVAEGADRALWRIEGHKSRTLRLLTVPPYLARSGKELLLPREVVEVDSIERK